MKGTHMKRTTRKKKTRRSAHGDKRARALDDLRKLSVPEVARAHDVPAATVARWAKEAGITPPDGRARRHHAPALPAAPAPAPPAPAVARANGNGNGKPAIEIHGLTDWLRVRVAEELGAIVERELPAALDRALARAYGGKSTSTATAKHG